MNQLFAPLTAFLARQLAHPTGWVGRVLMTRLLNRRNRGLIVATLDCLTLSEHTRLLDVGFGGGLSLRMARNRGVVKLSGLDPSTAAVDQLERTHRTWIHGGTLTLKQGVVEQLPFDTGTFDAIVSTNTVYFWPDLSSAFGELRRVLSSGGTLALGFASRQQLQALSPITQHGFLLHETDELLKQAREAGFGNVRLVELNSRDTTGAYVLVANVD